MDNVSAVTIQTVILIITLVASVAFTVVNIRISDRNRIYDYTSQLFLLYQERVSAIPQTQNIGPRSRYRDEMAHSKELGFLNQIANIQLQMKHILQEIESSGHHRLSPAQYRLMADCCDILLYTDEANKYWIKALSGNHLSPALKSEYCRYYGVFLYSINDISNGKIQFEKAVSLPESNDGDRYINCKSYQCWIESILANVGMYEQSETQRRKLMIIANDSLHKMKESSYSIKNKTMFNEVSKDYPRLKQLIEIYRIKT